MNNNRTGKTSSEAINTDSFKKNIIKNIEIYTTEGKEEDKEYILECIEDLNIVEKNVCEERNNIEAEVQLLVKKNTYRFYSRVQLSQLAVEYCKNKRLPIFVWQKEGVEPKPLFDSEYYHRTRKEFFKSFGHAFSDKKTLEIIFQYIRSSYRIREGKKGYVAHLKNLCNRIKKFESIYYPLSTDWTIFTEIISQTVNLTKFEYHTLSGPWVKKFKDSLESYISFSSGSWIPGRAGANSPWLIDYSAERAYRFWIELKHFNSLIVQKRATLEEIVESEI